MLLFLVLFVMRDSQTGDRIISTNKEVRGRSKQSEGVRQEKKIYKTPRIMTSVTDKLCGASICTKRCRWHGHEINLVNSLQDQGDNFKLIGNLPISVLSPDAASVFFGSKQKSKRGE